MTSSNTCRAAAMAAAMPAANRTEQCSAIAAVLIEHGHSMMDLSVGARLGENAGWPAARVAALREERDAMVGAIGLTAAEHDALLSTMERPRPVVDAKYEHAKPYSREDAAFDRAFERKHTGE